MSVPRRIIIGVGGGIVAFAAAIFTAVLLVPAERSFVNEVVIDVPPEAVWAVINDRERFPERQAKVKRVELVDSVSWVEHVEGTPEPLRFSLVVDERPKVMEFHYTMGDSFVGHWKGEAAELVSGTRLRTTDSYAANGAITKVLIYTFFDMDGFAKDWNARLRSRVESTSRQIR